MTAQTRTPIIGLVGPAGVGKSTVGGLLAARHPTLEMAFAEALKSEVCAAWSIPRFSLDDPVCKTQRDPWLALARCADDGFRRYAWELELPGLEDGLTPRTVMQRWGDWRRAREPDYFVRIVSEWIDCVLAAPRPLPIVLTDVRFPNEAAMLRRRGAVLWRITRPGAEQPGGHTSERRHAGIVVDAVIVNDGSLEQLAKIAADLFQDCLEAAARATTTTP